MKNNELSGEERQQVAAFLTELAEGKTCPRCHAAIESKKQIGRCIYANPCGHQLAQGRLKKEQGKP